MRLYRIFVFLNNLCVTVHTFHSYIDESQSMEDREYIITSKKRVVQFVQKWVVAVRNAVFEDPAAVDFIDVCIVQYFIVFHNIDVGSKGML